MTDGQRRTTRTRRRAPEPDYDFPEKKKSVMNDSNFGGFILFIILCLVTLFGGISSCTTIDAGSVGVVKHFGEVQNYTLPEGLHFVRPFGFANVDEVSTRMTAAEAEAKASSKDLQSVATVVSVQYSLVGEFAPRILQRIGDEKAVEATVLAPAFQESVKSVTAQYTAEELITKRGEVKAGIEKTLLAFVEKTLSEKDCKGAIKLANVAIKNFEFSKEFNEAIEAKVMAEQEALKAENEKKKRVTQAEAAAAETKLAAEAKAYQIENESKARADAIKRESAALESSPNLVQLRIAEKWDGKLPTYTGNAIPLMKLMPAQ